MKITVELSDDLYRRAKAEAALRGIKLNDLIKKGLQLVLKTPRENRGQLRLAKLMEAARGVVQSGTRDLAPNPEHLSGFGRDTRRDR